MKKGWAPLLACLFTLHSCGQQSTTKSAATTAENTSTVATITFTPGTIVRSVPCVDDASFTYALYIPTIWKKDQKLPVIALFDPHGDGAFPIEKYKEFADKYGYILAGSNDSKNGNPQERTEAILTHFNNSIRQALPLADNRLYAVGFSGGGRVAAMYALGASAVNGLMTCGAGFPADAWQKTPPDVVIGVAGNSDMNLHEIMNQQVKVADLHNRYQRIRFKGEHAWPPVSVMEQGIIAFETAAMKAGTIPHDATRISAMLETMTAALATEKKAGNSIAAASVAERAVQDFSSIGNTEAFTKSLKEISGSPAYTQAVAQEDALFKEEEKIRTGLMGAFGKADTSWWITQMAGLQQEKKRSPEAKAAMLSRASGTLSLICYMNLNQAIKSRQNEAVAYLTTLYRAIDPDNTEAWYLSASFEAQNGHPEKAVDFLKIAVSKGFTDRNRLNTDLTLVSLQGLPAYQELLTKLTH